MADLNTPLKSQPASAILRIILAKLQPRCCEVQFSPWSSHHTWAFHDEEVRAALYPIVRSI